MTPEMDAYIGVQIRRFGDQHLGSSHAAVHLINSYPIDHFGSMRTHEFINTLLMFSYLFGQDVLDALWPEE